MQMTIKSVASFATLARRRRLDLFATSLLIVGVILPVTLMALYLYLIAADQYASKAAFSVRSEQGGAVSQGFLGAIASVGGSGSAQDTDLLYDYIRSQDMVEAIDAKLDLRNIFRQRGEDMLLSVPPDASIEDLVRYWNRMVVVSKESRDGILRIAVRAFTPEDAQLILNEVLTASSDLINKLSQDARTDSLRLSRQLVDETRDQLRDNRRQLTEFRRDNRIITPEIEAETRSGLIAALQGKIADALVERDSITSYSSESDPRISAIDNRLKSLRTQLEKERVDLSQADKENDVDVYGVYEGLLLDQQMLNIAYGQALANEASAHAEARRQARYVAVHVPASLAQTPLYPHRQRIIFVTAAILFLIWLIVTVFYKSARDRI